jgi:hypothetical protein
VHSGIRDESRDAQRRLEAVVDLLHFRCRQSICVGSYTRLTLRVIDATMALVSRGLLWSDWTTRAGRIFDPPP